MRALRTERHVRSVQRSISLTHTRAAAYFFSFFPPLSKVGGQFVCPPQAPMNETHHFFLKSALSPVVDVKLEFCINNSGIYKKTSFNIAAGLHIHWLHTFDFSNEY